MWVTFGPFGESSERAVAKVRSRSPNAVVNAPMMITSLVLFLSIFKKYSATLKNNLYYQAQS